MEPSQESLCISSYNTTGFGIGTQNYLTTLSLFSNILCIQEHFLLDGRMKNHSNTDKIRKLFNQKYDMFIIPAHKDDSQVTKGRGKGGLATMCDKGLLPSMCHKSRLPVSDFKQQSLTSQLVALCSSTATFLVIRE